jgi:hypothetical protein
LEVGTGGEGTDESGVLPRPEEPGVLLTGKPLVAANLWMEKDGVLVITMKGRTGRFKLIEGEESCTGKEADDDPLTYHFQVHVSAVTNQENVLKHEEIPNF